MKTLNILLLFLLFTACNANKENAKQAKETIESYYKTYNNYTDVIAFDTFLTDNFKNKYKQDFIKNIQMFKDSFGPVLNFKNERMTILSHGTSLLKIRVVYDVEYNKFYNKEVFDLTKDDSLGFKIDAYKLDTYKLKN